MNALLHLANLLILLSFSVRDILWLRVISMAAAVSFIGFFWFGMDEPLWASIVWNLLFLAINGFQVWRLVGERRPVALDERARRVHALGFPSLTDRQLVRLLAGARFREVEGPLVTAGELPETLALLLRGEAEVEQDGRTIATLFPGHFVGELSWISRRPPIASVRARGPVEVVEWDAAALRQRLEREADLRGVVQQRLGTDLAEKLRAS